MRKPLRTMIAQGAVEFSEYFGALFQQVVIDGAVPRAPRLVAPEGMSTGGGKQARQAVVLEAKQPGHPPITIGWVDRATRSARLRTHSTLLAIHQQRFPKKPFDVDVASYQSFLQKVEKVLQIEGIQLTLEERSQIPQMQPEKGGISKGAMALFAAFLVLLFILGVGATYALLKVL